MASCNPMPNIQKESISSSSSSITSTYTSKLVLELTKLSLSKQLITPSPCTHKKLQSQMSSCSQFPFLARAHCFVLDTLDITDKLCYIMSTIYLRLSRHPQKLIVHFSTIPSKARFYSFPLQILRVEADGLMEFKYRTQVDHIPSKHEKSSFSWPPHNESPPNEL